MHFICHSTEHMWSTIRFVPMHTRTHTCKSSPIETNYSTSCFSNILRKVNGIRCSLLDLNFHLAVAVRLGEDIVGDFFFIYFAVDGVCVWICSDVRQKKSKKKVETKKAARIKFCITHMCARIWLWTNWIYAHTAFNLRTNVYVCMCVSEPEEVQKKNSMRRK